MAYRPLNKSPVSSNPTRSAIQSAIFAFSPGNSKTLRTFAHFLRPEGTGEAWIRPPAADLCSILSADVEPVPFKHSSVEERSPAPKLTDPALPSGLV
jgi:hypothetical protein